MPLDRSAKCGAIEELDGMRREMATLSRRLQAAKDALTATFDHLQRHSSNFWTADAAVGEPMKSNLQNFIQTVLDQFKQSSEAYQLNVDGDISSSRTSLTQDIRSGCAQITEGLDRKHGDVSDSGERPSLQ